ncbi:MAG: sugar phosphate isomerase/epimerase family protein [Verrucomicrobiales bacterium]
MKLQLLASVLTFIPTALVFAAETPGSFKAPVGLQLYSLRDSFKKSVPETLDKVKALGIAEVEIAGVQGLQPAEFKAMLDQRGLKAVSGHWPFERLDKEPEAVAAEAKALGCSFVACAWVPHAGAIFTEKDARKAIEVFNRAGEVMKQQALQFCYHAHGYEFQPFAGGTLFDLMAKEMKPGVADFQMDVFWVVHPGQDPVKLMQKYPDRFRMLHLKDWKKGARGNLSGHAPNEESVPLGTGVVDWPAVLREAEKIGVKHYFIEDEAPTVEQQLPTTISYLKTLRW